MYCTKRYLTLAPALTLGTYVNGPAALQDIQRQQHTGRGQLDLMLLHNTYNQEPDTETSRECILKWKKLEQKLHHHDLPRHLL